MPDIDLFSNTPVGIAIALVGAVILALGAQFQHAGVSKVDDPDDGASALSVRQLVALLRRPSWLIGTTLIGVAILFQLTSITMAPLTVVQPLGVVGLVVTSIVNARVSHVRLDHRTVRSIGLCVLGVALFVGVAAFTTQSKPISEGQLAVVLIVLGVVIALLGISLRALRARFTAMMYIVGAGILFGFVATLAKVVIDRVKTLLSLHVAIGPSELLTIGCLVLLLAAVLLGSYFQQSAYANGPPDLVVAGLTVVDPFVAIIIGIVILGEARGAPVWAYPAFVVAGGIAIAGVLQLAKHHPQANLAAAVR
ncbi:DMT family transporter [Galbitalea sp. SE-J8]|uniref:DMT family transporter n=1 Tax=Galbitalea sp. SE-J8 TaxID=3054952 RepID=UPI00259C92AF|nr:DMT family transporter [Galbitalea sp. SE-J8]MDM4761870.1 DMT family transporter [Galbitalea sp. SE-J8]